LLSQVVQIAIGTSVGTGRNPKPEVLLKGRLIDSSGAGMIANIFVFGCLNGEHIVEADSLILLLQRGQNGRRDQGGDGRDDGEHHQKFN
jgi:hypothetical protein